MQAIADSRHPAKMAVVFLGTSSGQPTLERGLSCVALIREGEIFLLDCGEGAQMQFRKAGLRFGKIAGICITHMHGDHVTGLPGILMSLQMAGRTAPLPIAGPPGLREYVETTARMIQTGFSYSLQVTETDGAATVTRNEAYEVTTEALHHRIADVGYRFAEHAFPGRFDVAAAQRLGVLDVRDYRRLQMGQSVIASHGGEVHPRQVMGPPRAGKVVAYCTDTRPCDGSVRLARDADVLIHESTFSTDRADDADLTGHSTAAQAAEIARAANVGRLLITHFSPRYNDVAILLAEARAIFPNTEAAQELVEYFI